MHYYYYSNHYLSFEKSVGWAGNLSSEFPMTENAFLDRIDRCIKKG